MADPGSSPAGGKRKSTDANGDEANLSKRPRSSSPSEEEQTNQDPREEEPRDPGKRAYREFSKLLKTLQTLFLKSDEEDSKQRIQVEVKKLRDLCSLKAAPGEEPNPWKMIQIQLKHTLLNSEKISEEDNVKNFLTGLEDSSASKSDRDNAVFVFLANFATELWYRWKEEEGQWEWTPDWEFWMPCSETVVSGGQWKGETPAPENVEIIKYLDAIRPVPSDEQYLPTFKFDVFVLFTKLHGLKDSKISENLRAIVAMLEGVELKAKNEHIASFKETLQKLKEQLV